MIYVKGIVTKTSAFFTNFLEGIEKWDLFLTMRECHDNVIHVIKMCEHLRKEVFGALLITLIHEEKVYANDVLGLLRERGNVVFEIGGVVDG